jgi:hypothetical protein
LRIVRILATFLPFVFVCSVSATTFPEAESKPMNIRLNDGIRKQFRVFPKKMADLLFPSGDAALSSIPIYGNWLASKSYSFLNIEVAALSDTRNRFKINVLVHDDQVFAFGLLFWDEDPGVMNSYLRATGACPQTTDQALLLTQLYLSLVNYDLVDPSRFVISRIEDVPKETVQMPNESLQDIKDIVQPPRLIGTGPDFMAEIFTHDMDATRVHKWTMRVGASGVSEVADEMEYPDHKAEREQFAKIKTKAADPDGTKIFFVIEIMGNGFTEDGAQTDIQVFAASDGPGVQRIHFYYKSQEKAEHRMEEFMKDSVAIIDEGPWINSSGASVGKRTTVILIDRDKKHLVAAKLFEDEKSVLELESFCLRNLLATGN